jgi:hypothetical protein
LIGHDLLVVRQDLQDEDSAARFHPVDPAHHVILSKIV